MLVISELKTSTTGSFLKKNYLNVKFVASLLEEIIRAMKIQEPPLEEMIIEKWGCHDDYIYSELLQECFQELYPCERRAIMNITRTVINESARAYAELLDDNYLHYEDFGGESVNINDLVDELKDDNQEY
jgi:hypothetical protein